MFNELEDGRITSVLAEFGMGLAIATVMVGVAARIVYAIFP